MRRCGSPKGRDQAKFIRSKEKKNRDDPIYDITQKMRMYQESNEERYIRSYSYDDGSPKVVAFTDSQLEDIANYCCNDVDGHKSLLFSDITFQLGPFYLLLTAYANTTLYYKGNANCPIMIGPLMLCLLKDKTTYITLFQKLLSKVPGIGVFLQGYATDSEAALRKALAQEFPSTLSFICTIHAKKNISEHCHELGLSQLLTNKIIGDIFGAGGLVFTSDRADFEKKYADLSRQWHELESMEKRNPGFVTYFEKNRKNDVYDHMRVQMAENAGFGNQLITTNPIESINYVVKRWRNFEASDMCTVLEELKDCIDQQRNNVKKAFLNLHSPYVVRSEYTKYTIQNFFSYPSQDREKLAARALQVKVNPKRYREVMDYKVPMATTRICLSEEEEEIPGIKSGDPFSKLISSFPRSDIDALRKKSTEIVDNGQIRPGFLNNEYIVKSTSCKYKTVSVCIGGKINCEKGCLGFQGRGICAHTVAVALHTSTLGSYLDFYLKYHQYNLTKTTVPAVNNNAGKKGATRKRGKSKSPDVMRKAAPAGTPPFTIGSLLSDNDLSGFQVTHVTASGMKMKLQQLPKPKKPKYVEPPQRHFN